MCSTEIQWFRNLLLKTVHLTQVELYTKQYKWHAKCSDCSKLSVPFMGCLLKWLSCCDPTSHNSGYFPTESPKKKCNSCSVCEAVHISWLKYTLEHQRIWFLILVSAKEYLCSRIGKPVRGGQRLSSQKAKIPFFNVLLHRLPLRCILFLRICRMFFVVINLCETYDACFFTRSD